MVLLPAGTQLELLSQYLDMNDIEVIHAKNGRAALELFKQMKFDLAVIDVMLPDTSGFKVAKVFKQQKPDVPFLFLTAKNKKEDIINGFKIGAEDYITKPFEPEELILRINRESGATVVVVTERLILENPV